MCKLLILASHWCFSTLLLLPQGARTFEINLLLPCSEAQRGGRNDSFELLCAVFDEVCRS